MNTPSLTLTDIPINIDSFEIDDESIGYASYYLDAPFGTEADVIAIRKVVDSMIDACAHVGQCELVSVTIAHDYFELRFSTTDPFNTQLGLLAALSDVPFPEMLSDEEDEDSGEANDERICDDCSAAKQAEQNNQADLVEGGKPKKLTFVGRIKEAVTNIFWH